MQIDDSKPAVNFKVVASPNSWQKSFVGQRNDAALDERRAYFYQFNEALINTLREKHIFGQPPAPTSRYETFIQRTHGRIRYGTAFSRNALRAGIWIDLPDAEVNRRIFEALQASRGEIESELGAPLHWDFDQDRHGQIVTLVRENINRDDATQITELADWAADALSRLRNVLEPRLDSIVPQASRSGPTSANNEVQS